MKFENYCMIEFLKQCDIDLVDRHYTKYYETFALKWYNKWSKSKKVIDFYSSNNLKLPELKDLDLQLYRNIIIDKIIKDNNKTKNKK